MNLFSEGMDVLFFDVTTLYFESMVWDDLRNFGFSKDCKFNQTQVVLALVTTTEGLPVTYRLFFGNLYEGHSLLSMIEEIRKVYDVSRVMLVADRAMFSQENLELMDREGIGYIVAAPLRKLPGTLLRDILSSDDFTLAMVEDDELHWLKEFEHRGRRLIVSYSPRRAKKDAADRSRAMERLLRRANNGKVKKDIVPTMAAGNTSSSTIKRIQAHILIYFWPIPLSGRPCIESPSSSIP